MGKRKNQPVIDSDSSSDGEESGDLDSVGLFIDFFLNLYILVAKFYKLSLDIHELSVLNVNFRRIY